MSQVSGLIAARSSCRRFADTPISENSMAQILEAAARAPTGGNVQSFRLMPLSQRSVLRRLYEVSGIARPDGRIYKQGFLLSAPWAVAVVCFPQEGVAKWGHLLKWDAEQDRYLQISIRDAAIASAFMVLQAEDLGLASCYMSSINQDDCRRILGLPDAAYVMTILCLGYRGKKETSRKAKKTVVDLVMTPPACQGSSMHPDEVSAGERMALSRKYRNTTSRPRDRVKGEGPSRQFLPAYQELIRLPSEIREELMQFLWANQAQNDLESSQNYRISDHCPLKFAIPPHFQHVLLTRVPEGQDVRQEIQYAEWTDAARSLRLYDWMREYFPQAFRVRLAVLPAGAEFGWHIDTNTSVACRCSVPLNESGARFEINIRGHIYSLPHEVDQVYFTNTGWPHRVYNPSSNARVNLVFGVPFASLARWIEPSSKPLY